MPVGEECQLPPPPVSVEPGLTTAHGGGGVEVEGGMENLGEDRKLRATGRRKRKVAASIRCWSHCKVVFCYCSVFPQWV